MLPKFTDDMPLWLNAVLKSIGIVGIVPFGCTIVVSMVLELQSYSYFLILALFLSVYFVFAFLGWVLIGLPTHYLLMKFTNGSFTYYLSVVMPITLVVFYFTDIWAALLFSGLATSQVALFKYFVKERAKRTDIPPDLVWTTINSNPQ
jgi:hypothetical protein